MTVTVATEKKVPLLDLSSQNGPIRESLLTAITRVIDSQKFIMGPDVGELEREIAQLCGVPYAIGCASGSDALYLALLAAGVGPGDGVLTTPFSFFATAGAISRVGATPVFADIEDDTFNLDPACVMPILELEPRVKAIIPVHLFGGCADMDPIMALAKERGRVVIEDGAQSVGAEYKGRKAQSIGDIGCISFFPSKNLGSFGDGGMITTKDETLAKKIASLRLHGTTKKYYHEWIGTNSRLDTIQAAVLRVKLPWLATWTDGRQRNAASYRRILGGIDLPIILPKEAPYQSRHVYNQFVVRCHRRDELKKHLQAHGVGTEIYYPLPLHLQPCYSELGYESGDFPVSELAAQEVLALPVHAGLGPDDIPYVCEQITAFFAG